MKKNPSILRAVEILNILHIHKGQYYLLSTMTNQSVHFNNSCVSFRFWFTRLSVSRVRKTCPYSVIKSWSSLYQGPYSVTSLITLNHTHILYVQIPTGPFNTLALEL